MVEVPREMEDKEMVNKVKKIYKKSIAFIEEKQQFITGVMITCGLIAYNTIGVYASQISGNLEGAGNSAQQEVLSWVEAVGFVGIIAGAIVWIMGNSKLAKNIIFCVGVGYILIKFAPQLWKWFIGIF